MSDPRHVTHKRTFEVVGHHSVHGKHKGDTLEIELTDDQADALISGGHVTEKLDHEDPQVVEDHDVWSTYDANTVQLP